MAEVSSHGRRGRAASVGTGGRRRLPHRPGHVPHAVDPDPCFPRVPRPLRLRGRLRFVSRAIFLVFRRGRDRAGDTAYCRASMPRPSMSDARCVAPPASRVRVYCFTLRVSFNGLVARFSAGVCAFPVWVFGPDRAGSGSYENESRRRVRTDRTRNRTGYLSNNRCPIVRMPAIDTPDPELRSILNESRARIDVQLGSRCVQGSFL